MARTLAGPMLAAPVPASLPATLALASSLRKAPGITALQTIAGHPAGRAVQCADDGRAGQIPSGPLTGQREGG
jgi:hypothetical protein